MPTKGSALRHPALTLPQPRAVARSTCRRSTITQAQPCASIPDNLRFRIRKQARLPSTRQRDNATMGRQYVGTSGAKPHDAAWRRGFAHGDMWLRNDQECHVVVQTLRFEEQCYACRDAGPEWFNQPSCAAGEALAAGIAAASQDLNIL